MTQVFGARTWAGVLAAAAAVDSGLVPAGRRVLVVADTSAVPEAHPPLHRRGGFEVLARRFDDVVDWNDLIRPLHPGDWSPTAGEAPMLGRFVRNVLGVGRDVGLVLQSLTDAPGRALAELLPDASITVCSPDLDVYGPTPAGVPDLVAQRVTALLHLDLLPGLAPVLLDGHARTTTVLPAATVLALLAEHPGAPDPGAHALLIGADPDDPFDTDTDLDAVLDAIGRRGHDRVVFAPPASAGRSAGAAAVVAAATRGLALTVLPPTVPVEVHLAATRPDLVVGWSPAVPALARELLDLPAATTGTPGALPPFTDPRRGYATIGEASLPRLRSDGTLDDPPAVDLDRLVQALAYCLQPRRVPRLRPAAVAHLAAHGPGRWFPVRRLQAVGLVRRSPVQVAGRTARLMTRTVRIGTIRRSRRAVER